MPRLTKPLLNAIERALSAALAGGSENFEAGDFAGQNPEHYERAWEWVTDEQQRRDEARNKRQRAAGAGR